MIPRNFRILNPNKSRVNPPAKFAFFLKIRLIFNIFYCFRMFVNKHLHISGMHISKSKRCYNVIPSVHYFYVKTELLAVFQICISVPLRAVFEDKC